MTEPQQRSNAPPKVMPLPRAAELAIVVPTFNERANILGVVAAVNNALPGVAWELMFVDDNSPDST